MPELPEVETIRQSLQVVQGIPIQQLSVKRDDIIRGQEYAPDLLEGRAWDMVQRRGKLLSFIFTGDQVMTVHLGMSGDFFCVKQCH